MDVKDFDCVRIGIDPLWDQRRHGYQFDDFELIVALSKNGPVILPASGSLSDLNMAAMNAAIGRSGSNLTYEIALSPTKGSPWKLEPRTIFGMAVLARATSAKTEKDVLLHWGKGLADGPSPGLFGIVGLGEAK